MGSKCFGLRPAGHFGGFRGGGCRFAEMRVPNQITRRLRRRAPQVLMICVSIFLAHQCWAQDTVEYGSAASSAAAKMAAAANGTKWTTNIPKDSNRAGTTARNASSPYLIAPLGPAADVVNRRALEEKAGGDAARMLLRSEPSGARVWVNGAFVGMTPILLIVPPGKYQIKVADDRSDHGEQTVGLLPHATREVVLRLAAHYPTRVAIH